MYGWRGRIGHIAPSRGDVLVYEFYQMAPKGLLMLNSTGTIRQLDRNDLERQWTRIEEAAKDLAETGVDLIVVGGSPLFTLQGLGSDSALCTRLTGAVGVPVTALITAEVEALRSVGARRLVVVSPHRQDLNDRMERFLVGSGFEVATIGGLGILRNSEIGQASDDAAYRLAKKLYFEAKGADAIFIDCPRWPTIVHSELLEQETGVPVITSSEAFTWMSLKMLNIRERITGYGRLLASLAPAA